MTRTRRVIVAVAIIVVPVVGWVVWQQRDTSDGSAAIPVGAPVNPAVTNAKLLQDVADINASRAAGEPNFSYVPTEQPPDLIRMNAGGQGTQITDGYTFGTKKYSAIVMFTPTPATSCPDLCIRKSTTVPAAAETPAFRNVTVSFSGNVQGGPSTTDPATAAAMKFWTTVTFIPADQATWYHDLTSRAAQATDK